MTIQVLKESLRATVSEIRHVRYAEKMATADVRIMRLKQRLLSAGLKETKIERILRRHVRNNVYGFAETAEKRHQDPNPEWIFEAEDRRWNLHQRRVIQLRRRARWQNLAYGFLRDIPYRDMERVAYEPPPWHMSNRREDRMNKAVLAGDNTDGRDYVLEIAISICGDIPEQIVRQNYARWLDGAGRWEHPSYNQPTRALKKLMREKTS